MAKNTEPVAGDIRESNAIAHQVFTGDDWTTNRWELTDEAIQNIDKGSHPLVGDTRRRAAVVTEYFTGAEWVIRDWRVVE